MTQTQQAPAPYAPATQQRSAATAYKWFIWLSGFGAHQFYLGRPGAGLLRLFTLNALGILWIVDSFTLDAQTDRANASLGH